MATKPDVEADVFIFQWKIENISQCFWMKLGESIDSPSFIIDALGGTKWSLSVFPFGFLVDKKFAVLLNREKDCSGPKVAAIFIELSFLGKDGHSLLKQGSLKCPFKPGESRGFPTFIDREDIFFKLKEAFLPEDTLTVRFKIRIRESTPFKLEHLYARTALNANRRYFLWRIDEVSTLKTGLRKKIIDELIDFDLFLNAVFDRLGIDAILCNGSKIKYISCNTSIVDSEGKKEICGMKKYINDDLKKGVLSTCFSLEKFMKNESRYLPNDVLSLEFEFVFSTVDHFEYGKDSYFESEPHVGKDENRSTRFLTEDLKSMYNGGIFSDVEIRTSTKNFPAHKAILSARSAVFSRMFSNDMREANSGHVDITDFEDDTIHRMLLFIYTDYLEDLQFESAFELYKIADKYDIMSLKRRCSSFLIVSLSPTNACDVFALAHRQHDHEFTNVVQNYIIGQRGQFFDSQEWRDFMASHGDLAIQTLHKIALRK